MNLPDDFLQKLGQVKGKRARIVVDHILEHGSITTEELVSLYGYKHPPRAIRDVREQGIPLESFTARADDGRLIAAYRFDPPAAGGMSVAPRRQSIPKAFRQSLIAAADTQCAFCRQRYQPTFLQVDHRVPYEIGGNAPFDTAHFAAVCRSCNRTKSWTCEHCPNWAVRDVNICQTCFWVSPESYQHVAGQPIRQIILTLYAEDQTLFERLADRAAAAGVSLHDYIVAVLRETVSDSDATI